MAPKPRRNVTLPPFQGHEELLGSLAKSVRSDRLPSTLLIHGEPGVGKQRLALWLSQLFFCEASTAQGPCNTCQPCTMVQNLGHPDLHWHIPLPRPKGASTPEKLADALEIDRLSYLGEVRAQPLQPKADDPGQVKGLYLASIRRIRKNAYKRPSMGDCQVFIIGDAEYLVPQEASPEAANALLKLLEEPPDGSRFILTTSRPGSLLDTIRSRALPIHLPNLPVDHVAQFLEDSLGTAPEEAQKAARLSQGSIGLALGYLGEDALLEDQRRAAYSLLSAAMSGHRGKIYKIGLETSPAGARGKISLLSELEAWIRDLLATSAGQSESVINHEQVPALKKMLAGRTISPERAAHAIEYIEEAKILAQGNVNPQLLIPSLLLDLEQTLAS